MLVGRYEILEAVGRGATSSVSKARDTLIGRIVALKTLQPDLNDLEWLERFLSEAQIVGQLSHPSIVSLYDVGIDEASGTPYLVMEYVIGQTLEQLLPAGETKPEQAYTWGANLARALAYAHSRGVVHGDVKPANILVSQDGCVKLTDFGVARWARHTSQTGSLRGTPAFLAPEQIEGSPTDARSDLFSLGIVLYRLATGRLPFQGDSVGAVCAQILTAVAPPPTQINPTLPRALDGVLACCLAKNPADRYANGDELAAALEAFAPQTPAGKPEKTAASRPDKGKAKRSAAVLRRYGWAAGLLVLALSTSLAWGSFRTRLQLPPPPALVFSAPKPPADLRLYSDEKQNPEGGPRPESTVATKNAGRIVRPRPTAAAKIPKRSRQPSRIVVAQNAQGLPRSKSATMPANAAESSHSSAAAVLSIEIFARPSDEIVAVFADHRLLFSTSLATVPVDEGEPLRASPKLPFGQHHLSVALYKTNKALRTQKEGLADLRKGANNVLAIEVTRPSKFLPLRGPGLKVAWPRESTTSNSGRNTEDFAAKAPH